MYLKIPSIAFDGGFFFEIILTIIKVDAIFKYDVLKQKNKIKIKSPQIHRFCTPQCLNMLSESRPQLASVQQQRPWFRFKSTEQRLLSSMKKGEPGLDMLLSYWGEECGCFSVSLQTIRLWKRSLKILNTPQKRVDVSQGSLPTLYQRKEESLHFITWWEISHDKDRPRHISWRSMT